jgi:hypothetical protein
VVLLDLLISLICRPSHCARVLNSFVMRSLHEVDEMRAYRNVLCECGLDSNGLGGGPLASFSEHGYVTYGSIKGMKFLGQLSDYLSRKLV